MKGMGEAMREFKKAVNPDDNSTKKTQRKPSPKLTPDLS